MQNEKSVAKYIIKCISVVVYHLSLPHIPRGYRINFSVFFQKYNADFFVTWSDTHSSLLDQALFKPLKFLVWRVCHLPPNLLNPPRSPILTEKEREARRIEGWWGWCPISLLRLERPHPSPSSFLQVPHCPFSFLLPLTRFIIPHNP